MDKPSGNSTAGNPLDADDPRFNVNLVTAVGQCLTRRDYRAPADPEAQRQAYQDFAFLLALLVRAFEGKGLGAFEPIARSYMSGEALAKETLRELDRLAHQAMRQRAVIGALDAAIEALNNPDEDHTPAEEQSP